MFGHHWYDSLSLHQLRKKQQQKDVVKVGPPLAKLSGSAQNVQTRPSLH